MLALVLTASLTPCGTVLAQAQKLMVKFTQLSADATRNGAMYVWDRPDEQAVSILLFTERAPDANSPLTFAGRCEAKGKVLDVYAGLVPVVEA